MKDQSLIAHHESGHTLIAYLSGLPFERVMLVEGNGSLDSGFHAPQPNKELRRIQMYMAGPCAQWKFSGEAKQRAERHLRNNENGDAETVQRLLDNLELNLEARDSVFFELLDMTWQAVCEGQGWTATRAIAAELLKANVLEYLDVEAILSPFDLQRSP